MLAVGPVVYPGTMSKLSMVISVVVLALAFNVTAFAGNGFRVWGTAQHRPTTGSAFSVLSHGRTPQKSLLSVYLDRQPCAAAWKNESKRFTSFSAGQSSFRSTGKAFVTMWVNGHFSKMFVARAGTKAEPEYACSYLTTPNSKGQYRITAARRSNAYFVAN